MAARRRNSKAATSQVIEFFSTAPDAAKQIVDYFKSADTEQAQAALAVASAIVAQKTGSGEPTPRTPRNKPQAQPAQASETEAGKTAPSTNGNGPRTMTASKPSDSEPKGAGRVVGQN